MVFEMSQGGHVVSVWSIGMFGHVIYLSDNFLYGLVMENLERNWYRPRQAQ